MTLALPALLIAASTRVSVVRLPVEKERHLLRPCACQGSALYVHYGCLWEWIKYSLSKGKSLRQALQCPVCKERYRLPLGYDLAPRTRPGTDAYSEGFLQDTRDWARVALQWYLDKWYIIYALCGILEAPELQVLQPSPPAGGIQGRIAALQGAPQARSAGRGRTSKLLLATLAVPLLPPQARATFNVCMQLQALWAIRGVVGEGLAKGARFLLRRRPRLAARAPSAHREIFYNLR